MPGDPARPLVLVVEDSEADWEVYGRMLWYNGYDVLHAPDGVAGLRLARERRPDLVLLDLDLPELPGLDVCRRLTADPDTAAIPVVILTAYRAHFKENAARLAGCSRFLEKPLGPVEVLHEVESLIGQAPPSGEQRREFPRAGLRP